MNLEMLSGKFEGVVCCWFLALIIILVFKPERISNSFLFRLSIGLFITQYLLEAALSLLPTVFSGLRNGSSFSRLNGMSTWLPIYQFVDIGKGLADALGILALFGSLGIRGALPKKVKPVGPPKKHPLDD